VAEQFTFDDKELVEGLKNGQRSAFSTIFQRHWYTVYHSVYARIKSHEDAEEIVQDLFCTLWNKRNSLEIPDLSNYLLAAARKRVLNYFRSGKVRKKYIEYYRHFNSFIEESPEGIVQHHELSDAVEAIMQRLPEKTQRVFRLNRLEGYSITEISERLKLPKRTIGYHLTKSLKEFQLHLKDFITIILLFII
jgi:RNA polymerase sigma-70 factor (family 1)